MKFIKSMLIMMLFQSLSLTVSAQEKLQMVRLAKLVIDSAFLESYKSLLKEGIEAAFRTEPGVLTLFALAEKDRPTYFTILETYTSFEAYQTHIKSPHFLKYKQATLHMVKSLELIDTEPLIPESRIIQTTKN